MNETVFNYVRKFYTRATHELEYMKEYNVNPPSTDEFFKNWTINFHDGGDPEYRLYDGTLVDSYLLYQLVHKDSKKGFFIREMRAASVNYHFTELGKDYLMFKLEL